MSSKNAAIVVTSPQSLAGEGMSPKKRGAEAAISRVEQDTRTSTVRADRVQVRPQAGQKQSSVAPTKSQAVTGQNPAPTQNAKTPVQPQQATGEKTPTVETSPAQNPRLVASESSKVTLSNEAPSTTKQPAKVDTVAAVGAQSRLQPQRALVGGQINNGASANLNSVAATQAATVNTQSAASAEVKERPAAARASANTTRARYTIGFSPSSSPNQALSQQGNLAFHSIAATHGSSTAQTSNNNTGHMAKNGASNDAVSLLPANSETTQSAPMTPADTKAATRGLAGGQKDDTASELRQQIHESVRASVQSGAQQVTIRLHPPELGSVSVKFRQQDGQITGELAVAKAETRAQIQEALPDIVRSLQQAGVQLKRLDVSLSDFGQSHHEAGREQLMNQAWSAAGDSAYPRDGRDSPIWQQETNQAAASRELVGREGLPGAAAGDVSSINILI